MSATGCHNAVFHSLCVTFENAPNSVSQTMKYYVPKIRVDVQICWYSVFCRDHLDTQVVSKFLKFYGNQMSTTLQKIKSDQLNLYVSSSFFNIRFNIILIRA